MRKPGPKPEKPYKKLGATYKAPGTFKSFNGGGIELKLLNVISMDPTQVFSAIRGRQPLP